MIDKRKFHHFLNNLKDEHTEQVELLEVIQKDFEKKVDGISSNELKALKRYPIQYVKRIQLKDGEWTSQLHIWAEQCVPQILDLDSVFLAYKNSVGDSVLMSFIVGCTGSYTETVNYELIQKALDTDLSYEDIEKDENQEETVTIKNALDEKDLNGQTVLEYLINFAYAVEQFVNTEPDEQLQEILKDFSQLRKKQVAEEQSIQKDRDNQKAEEDAQTQALAKEEEEAETKTDDDGFVIEN